MSTAQLNYDEVSKVSFEPSVAPQRVRRSEKDATGNQKQTPRGKRRLALWGGLAAAALAVASVTAYVRYAAHYEETDNAFVEADVHPISTRVAGTVVEVLVDDNEQVEKGQVLARLDAPDFEVKLSAARTDLQQSEAQVPQTEAALAQTRALLRQTESQIQSTAAQLKKATLDYERTEKISRSNTGAISTQERDAAKAALDSATASHEAAVAARDAASAGVLSAEANRSVAEARVLHAKTAVADAELQLSYTALTAPVSGRIGKKTVETGQRVQPGQALMAVVADDKWIVANFKENQLSQMKPGQPVEIRIDAIEGRHFTGRVDSFAPGTGAKFALLPPDNATGNFTKIVQRVPVKIHFDKDTTHGFEQRIAPGLSAIAEVRVKE